MAEAIAITASVIALVQLADRISDVCKLYIETIKGSPEDLRLLYVEVASLKVILEGLSFLGHDDASASDQATLVTLQGPVEECKNTLDELEKLLPHPRPLPDRSNMTLCQNILGSLTWPIQAGKVKKLLEKVQQPKATISLALLTQLKSDVGQIKDQVEVIYKDVDETTQRHVGDWIRGPMPVGTSRSVLHEEAKNRYEEGTGDWIFQTDEWKNWINGKKRAIWLHGIPGAGKTILAGRVFEKIRGICKPNQLFSYYYCYHGHNQDESGPFFRNLVADLLATNSRIPEFLWKGYRGNELLNQDELTDVLKNLLSHTERIYVGIDALDESEDRKKILNLLETLATDDLFSKIQLFTTSRLYEDIKDVMSDISQPLSMSNDLVKADIKRYVGARIRDGSEKKFRAWSEPLRKKVEDTLATGARGMFRWAACQLDVLRRLDGLEDDIEKAMMTLPRTLDETYDRIFRQSAPQEQGPSLLRHALHMVCFHDAVWHGQVPLRARLLLDSYCYSRGAKPGSVVGGLDTLKDVCGCLLSFSEGDNPTVLIAHYTVREFLESDRGSEADSGWVKIHRHESYSTILTQFFTCALDSGMPVPPEPIHYDVIPDLGLRVYCTATAVGSLPEHEELVAPEMLFRLLDPSEAHCRNMEIALGVSFVHFPTSLWIQSFRGFGCGGAVPVLTSLLLLGCHSSARTWLRTHGRELLREHISWDLSLGTSWMPKIDPHQLGNRIQGTVVELLAQVDALRIEHIDLIEEIAPNHADYSGMAISLLSWASADSRPESMLDEIWERLVELGADPDPKGARVTPLQIACRQKRGDWVRRLLKSGADPNNTGNPQGLPWDEELFISRFNSLHGYTPAEILTHCEKEDLVGKDKAEDRDAITNETAEILDLLVSYEPTPIDRPPPITLSRDTKMDCDAGRNGLMSLLSSHTQDRTWSLIAVEYGIKTGRHLSRLVLFYVLAVLARSLT